MAFPKMSCVVLGRRVPLCPSLKRDELAKLYPGIVNSTRPAHIDVSELTQVVDSSLEDDRVPTLPVVIISRTVCW